MVLRSDNNAKNTAIHKKHFPNVALILRDTSLPLMVITIFITVGARQGSGDDGYDNIAGCHHKRQEWAQKLRCRRSESVVAKRCQFKESEAERSDVVGANVLQVVEL